MKNNKEIIDNIITIGKIKYLLNDDEVNYLANMLQLEINKAYDKGWTEATSQACEENKKAITDFLTKNNINQ